MGGFSIGKGITYNIGANWSEFKSAFEGAAITAQQKAAFIKESVRAMASEVRANAQIQVEAIKSSAAIQINEAKLTAQAVRDEAKAQALAVTLALQEQANEAKKLASANRQAANESMEAWRNFQSSIQAITIAAGGAMYGLTSILKGASHEFANFEATMIRFQAFTGASATQMEALKDKSMALGKETQYSNTQVSQAAGVLAAMGFSADQATKALDSVVSVAIISGKGLQETAMNLGVTIHAFGFAAEEGGHIADVLATIAKNGGDVSAATEAFHYLGAKIREISPDSKTLSNNFESLAGMLDIANKAGVKGGQFGMDFAQALTHLLAPTKEGKEAMIRMSLATEDAGGKFKSFAENSDGTIKPLSEIVKRIKEATEGMTVMEREDYLKKIFAVHALTALNPILQKTQEELEAIDEKYHKTTGTSKALGDQLQTGLAHAFELLTGSIETASSSMGETFAPGMVKVLGLIQSLFDGFTALSPTMRGLVTDAVLAGTGVSGLAFIIGGAAIATNESIKAVKGLIAILPILKAEQTLTAASGVALGTAETAVGTGAAAAAGGIRLFTLAINPWVAGIAIVSAALYGVYELLSAINGQQLGDLGLEKAMKTAKDARAATAGAGQRLEDKLQQGLPGSATETRDAAIDNRLKAADISNKIIENEQTIAELRKGMSIDEIKNGSSEINRLLAKNKLLKEQHDSLMGISKEQSKISQDIAHPEKSDKKFVPVKTAKELEEERKKAEAKELEDLNKWLDKKKTAVGLQIERDKQAIDDARSGAASVNQDAVALSSNLVSVAEKGLTGATVAAGQCYHYFSETIKKIDKDLYNDIKGTEAASAYMFKAVADRAVAAGKLERYYPKNINEVTPGTIAVYQPGVVSNNPAGHVGVIGSDKADYSDKRYETMGGAFGPQGFVAQGTAALYRYKGTAGGPSPEELKAAVEMKDTQAFVNVLLEKQSHYQKDSKAFLLLQGVIDQESIKAAKDKTRLIKAQADEQEKRDKAEDKARKELIKLDMEIARDRLKLGKESLENTIALLDQELEANHRKNAQELKDATSDTHLSEAAKLALKIKFDELDEIETKLFLKRKEDAARDYARKLQGIQDDIHQYELDLMADSEAKIIAESDFKLKKTLANIQQEQDKLKAQTPQWVALEQEKTAIKASEMDKRAKLLSDFHDREIQLERQRIEKQLNLTETGKSDLERINKADIGDLASAEVARLNTLHAFLLNIQDDWLSINNEINNSNLSVAEKNAKLEKQKELVSQIKNAVQLIDSVESGQEERNKAISRAKQKIVDDVKRMEIGIKGAADMGARFISIFGDVGQSIGNAVNNIADLGLGIKAAMDNIKTKDKSGKEGFDLSKLFNLDNIGDTIGLITKVVSMEIDVLKSAWKFWFPDQAALAMEKNKFIAEISKIDTDIMSVRFEGMKKDMQSRGVADIATLVLPEKQILLARQKQQEQADLFNASQAKMEAAKKIGNLQEMLLTMGNISSSYQKSKQGIDEKYAQLEIDAVQEVENEKKASEQRQYEEGMKWSKKLQEDSEQAAAQELQRYADDIKEKDRLDKSLLASQQAHTKTKIALMDNERDRSLATIEAEKEAALAQIDYDISHVSTNEELIALGQRRVDLIDETTHKTKLLNEQIARELSASTAKMQEDTAVLLAQAGNSRINPTVDVKYKSNQELVAAQHRAFMDANVRDEAEAVRKAATQYGASYADTQKNITAIHAFYAAQRVNHDAELQKQSLATLKQIATESAGTLQEALKYAYESAIKPSQTLIEADRIRLRLIEDQTKEMNNQIAIKNAEAEKELRAFKATKKESIERLVKEVDLEGVTRSALGQEHNPEGVPTGTYSSEAQRSLVKQYLADEKAKIQALFDMSNQTQADEDIYLENMRKNLASTIAFARKIQNAPENLSQSEAAERDALKARIAETFNYQERIALQDQLNQLMGTSHATKIEHLGIEQSATNELAQLEQNAIKNRTQREIEASKEVKDANGENFYDKEAKSRAIQAEIDKETVKVSNATDAYNAQTKVVTDKLADIAIDHNPWIGKLLDVRAIMTDINAQYVAAQAASAQMFNKPQYPDMADFPGGFHKPTSPAPQYPNMADFPGGFHKPAQVISTGGNSTVVNLYGVDQNNAGAVKQAVLEALKESNRQYVLKNGSNMISSN